MSDIVKLLREAAAFITDTIAAHDEWADSDNRDGAARRLWVQQRDALSEAADELEASAEWALCKWLAEDESRSARPWPHSDGVWIVYLSVGMEDPRKIGEGRGRADAIRAAIKAWEER